MESKENRMSVDDYLVAVAPMSIPARFSIGLRLFERYVRLRGVEDELVWEFLEAMWQFPGAEDKLAWEKKRGDLADFGLGDELPEELEEELASLGINEDYFELWVSAVTELAWTNLLKGPQDDESLEYLRGLLELAHASGMTVPVIEPFKTHLFSENEGWGGVVSADILLSWQLAPCAIELTGGSGVNVAEQMDFD